MAHEQNDSVNSSRPLFHHEGTSINEQRQKQTAIITEKRLECEARLLGQTHQPGKVVYKNSLRICYYMTMRSPMGHQFPLNYRHKHTQKNISGLACQVAFVERILGILVINTITRNINYLYSIYLLKITAVERLMKYCAGTQHQLDSWQLPLVQTTSLDSTLR